MRKGEVLIIGGGVLGCSSAYYLSKRGMSVILVERGELCSEATGATTAGITVQNKPMDRIPFYREAADRWMMLEEELGFPVGYDRCGSVMVADTVEQMSGFQKRLPEFKKVGLEVELLSASETRDMSGWVTDELAGSLYCPVDGHAEPKIAPQAFAQAAKQQGAVLLSNEKVVKIYVDGQSRFRIVTSQGEISVDKIINAAGAWAGFVSEMLDISLPVSFEPLQSMVFRSSTQWLDKVVLHASNQLTVKQIGDGSILIGGGWSGKGDIKNDTKSPDFQNRSACLELAYATVPRLSELELVKTLVGLEGRTSDRFPFFGEIQSVPGFYMLACAPGGFTLSPLMSEQLAELIVERSTRFPMTNFTRIK